tara:strand:+ start:527 stop:745 length:219 start_codon:yes stop_codon:yes gene_type:complete
MKNETYENVANSLMENLTHFAKREFEPKINSSGKLGGDDNSKQLQAYIDYQFFLMKRLTEINEQISFIAKYK